MSIIPTRRLLRPYRRWQSEDTVQSLYLLIPVALLFVVLAVRFLFWAIKSGQYDDLNTEGHRILFDDDAPQKQSGKNEKSDKTSPPVNECEP